MALTALIEEAMRNGYESPCKSALLVCIPRGVSGHVPNTYWHQRFAQLETELPGWSDVILKLRQDFSLSVLATALDYIHPSIAAPCPSRIFYAMSKLAAKDVKVVFVAQDPYPTTDASPVTLKAAKTLDSESLGQMIGEEFRDWPLAKPNVERGTLGAIPYAMGRALGYPKICSKPPVSWTSMRESVRLCYPAREPVMDPELETWSSQGVLMLNSCPILYGQSSKNPHVFTTWTSEILRYLASTSQVCVFVLLGKAAQSFKPVIITEHSNACIIEAGHPSSRNKKNDFVTQNVFSKINEFRDIVSKETGSFLPPIVW